MDSDQKFYYHSLIKHTHQFRIVNFPGRDFPDDRAILIPDENPVWPMLNYNATMAPLNFTLIPLPLVVQTLAHISPIANSPTAVAYEFPIRVV